jgi:hypothetical protein
MVLLGDEAQVESRFGLFKDSISVGAGRCRSIGYARYAPVYPTILETITVYTCIFFEKNRENTYQENVRTLTLA